MNTCPIYRVLSICILYRHTATHVAFEFVNKCNKYQDTRTAEEFDPTGGLSEAIQIIE